MKCVNGGTGLFCCTNGAENVDCCDNGGSGPDCCTNGGRGQFCCSNGADNADCCENGGSGNWKPSCCATLWHNKFSIVGQYCCTNGADNADCSIPTPPPLPSFVPSINLPKVIPLKPEVKPVEQEVLPIEPEEQPEEPEFELDARIEEDAPAPPPIPSFIPLPNFPKVIPVKPIVASTPAPFAPRPAYPSVLPVKPDPVPSAPAPFVCPMKISSPVPASSIQGRFSGATKSPNEYLPPLDVRGEGRSDFSDDWESWKVSEMINQ